MFVVTGCGRSGTAYTAALLSTVGVRCGHERLFTPWIDAPPGPAAELDGDASWLAAPFVGALGASDLVVHQVRDPMAVVASLVGIGFFSPWRVPAEAAGDAVESVRRVASRRRRRPIRADFRRFLRRYAPAVELWTSPVQRAVEYWITWNGIVEERADPRRYRMQRVEDLDAVSVGDLLRAVGFERDPAVVAAALDAIPRFVNAGPHLFSPHWDDLPNDLSDRFRASADRYGYHLDG
jgi:hypothetical protein